jgi:FixJ family two-component response regulator/GGDEF domain-containing protein
LADKVLFVDDEQGILDGYQRLLRKEFDVSVALGGQLGLTTIQEDGPYAVVISDMRMPGMSGAEFLAQVRQQAPDSVRMLLTGYTDLSAAIDAVNEGNIFRFLTKPCEKEALVSAINIGVTQYNSITAEKEFIRKARIAERLTFDEKITGVCPWDNFEGSTGLGGPTQARALVLPLIGIDPLCYVVLLRLTVFKTLETRYGEEAAGDYLNSVAQYLMQSLRSQDRLFHWDRDVLMAVLQRRIAPAALHMEIARLTAANHQHVMEVEGRSIMVASSITFELQPVSQFSTFNDMIAEFGDDFSEEI